MHTTSTYQVGANHTRIDQLRISIRWGWLGPVCGILAMVGLFAFGLIADRPQILVIASTCAVCLAGMWVGIAHSLKLALNKEVRQ